MDKVTMHCFLALESNSFLFCLLKLYRWRFISPSWKVCTFCNCLYDKITSLCSPYWAKEQWLDSDRCGSLTPFHFLAWDGGGTSGARKDWFCPHIERLWRNIESVFLQWIYFFLCLLYNSFVVNFTYILVH